MRPARSAPEGRGETPEWLITFADLMSLLVVFFVLIISFSIQDQEKVQIVSGSMKDAFGVTKEVKKKGLIESDAVPKREKHFARRSEHLAARQGESLAFELPNLVKNADEKVDKDHPRKGEGRDAMDEQLVRATATLRQAWSEQPDIAEYADNILMETTPQGVHIQIVDQQGRAMFAPGSREPHAHTRALLERLTMVLRRLPNRIIVTGHTSSEPAANSFSYTNWDLSADRANTVRRIFTGNGLDPDRIEAVQGKADNEPLFPNNSELPANGRVAITLLREPPPLPNDLEL